MLNEVEHSQKFDLVKDYFDTEFWTEMKVRKAVDAGWITRDEYKEITKLDYPEPNI